MTAGRIGQPPPVSTLRVRVRLALTACDAHHLAKAVSGLMNFTCLFLRLLAMLWLVGGQAGLPGGGAAVAWPRAWAPWSCAGPAARGSRALLPRAGGPL